MIRLPKETEEQLVLDLLLSICQRENMSTKFMQNSLDIMYNEVDNSVLTGALLTKTTPSLLNEQEMDMKICILSSLQSVYSCGKEESDNSFVFDENLSKEFCYKDQDKCTKSAKLNFSIYAFINAFFEYERLEKKYPDLMKIM